MATGPMENVARAVLVTWSHAKVSIGHLHTHQHDCFFGPVITDSIDPGSRAVVGWGHAGVTLPRLVTDTHWEWITIHLPLFSAV
jgi:hypothetical protein